MKHSGKLMAALAAAGLMVLFGAGAALCAEQTRDSISVTGYASQESEPDMAVVSLSLTEYGKTAADTRAALRSGGGFPALRERADACPAGGRRPRMRTLSP